MFLQDLSNTEKVAFIGLAKQLVLADGSLNTEEELLLNQMLKEMQLTGEEAPKDTNLDFLANEFTTLKSKTICLIELIALGYANMEYHDLEKEFVNELASRFGISLEKTIEIESWVVKQLAHLYEAEEFWQQSIETK